MFVSPKIMILVAAIIKVSVFPVRKVTAFLPQIPSRCRFSSIRCRRWNPALGSSNRENVDFLTKSTLDNFQRNRNGIFEGLLSSALNRAQSTLEQTREFSSTVSVSNNDPTQGQTSKQEKPPTMKTPSKAKTSYRGNPTITNTALAHSLWREILKPNQDSAIDATCGNGHDTLAMAEMLFSDPDNASNSKLLALDIQQRACQSTTDAIRERFGSDILHKHIEVRQTSHAPLPRPSSDNVGLVVYNLGWLPNSDHKNGSNQNDFKDCITKVESTLQSLTDAALMIRIGGMISVTTYPKTNSEEDLAVRVFLECLALLSSNIQTWREFLDEIHVVEDDDDDGSSSQEKMSKETMELIVAAMERIVREGDAKQTFRVSEHRKLGMDRAPILLTAVRIK